VKVNGNKTIRYIDLFAGIGGFRLGFERAAEFLGFQAECVLTSEIKKSALQVYSENFHAVESLDITALPSEEIPPFDFLLAGFPCQAFSNAGKREGFLDTRGTLFFEIERILRHHKPAGFILENVEGLVTHDRKDSSKPIGRTLDLILEILGEIGYKTNWKVLDSSNFGLAQQRRRVFIVGTLDSFVPLSNFETKKVTLKKILEKKLETESSKTIDLLLEHYKLTDLPGKSLKDKRGGVNNIHSWDIGLKGPTSKAQRELLNALLRYRRNKKWGEAKGINWMDGMPLTLSEIKTFFNHKDLKVMLDDLVSKGYLVFEHPKDLVFIGNGKDRKAVRKYRTDIPKGYNIVAGKLSFEISKILDPNHLAPTLVATDLDRMMVIQSDGLRRLTYVEMLRLFGFPDGFKLNLKRSEITDLFGNSVPVNAVQAVAERAIDVTFGKKTQSPFFRESLQIEDQMSLF
jgi:DNA (cytosine-5)-methyltransferase 1